uniref:SSD domain-containing protein n=1 Tax=Emiliania huxleyi TaxID=2903 RepID=A0A7S3W1W8_EMIHU
MGLEACQSAVFRACHSYHSAAGRLVAKRPAASLVASLVVTLLLTACMLLGSWEARLEYRDTLSRSEAFKLFDATLDMFGGSPRTNEYKMSSSDGSNVLTKQAILKALEVDEAVLGLTYKGTRFEDVCLRPYLGGACTVDSAMYRLGLGREEVEALSQEELDSKLLAEYNSNAGGLGSLLGGLTLTDGKLSATSLRFRYLGEPSGQGRPSFVEFVTGTSNDALASATLEWESAFLALVCARPLMSSGIECATDSLSLGEGLSVTGTAQRFIQDEIAANATTSTKWMVVSINLILVLMWLALGGRPLRNSRLTLGTGAVAVILLSVGAGLGFSSLVGVPLTEISLLMVFVIVGVGVDDVIVVVDFLQRQPPHLSIVERISGALGGAGPAIQLTSLTNLIAFLIAATVDFPGVSYFCLSAGFTLFALFLLTTTLFTALLTFDERRRGAMRLDCLCCIGFGAGDSETGDAEPSSPSHKEDDKRAHSGLRAAVSSAARAYDCFVASKPVALVVILAFTSLIPLGFGFAIGNIPLGAELASYFPDGSPYVAYTADTQENFVALDTPGYLVLRDVKWEDASAQTAVDSLLAALESDDFVIAPYSTNNWLAAYRAVAADRGATASAAPPLRQSGDGFLADVAAFLKETDPQCVDRQLGGECLREIIPARYSKEVVWAGEAGASPITATRFSCTLAVPDEVKGRVELMNEHRATADANRGSIDAVVWSYFMLFSDRDRVRPQWRRENREEK